MNNSDPQSAEERYPTVPWGTLVGRALQLKCPRCGVGPMFSGWFTMHRHCSHCRMKYERDPGYFLGSIYINYGLTAVGLTFLYVLLHFGFNWSNTQLALPLAVFCCVLPMLVFRHTRALWLAMDCHWDASAMVVEPVDADTEQSDIA